MKEKLEQLFKLYDELKQFVIESTKDNPLFLFHFKDGKIVDPETSEEMGSWTCCGTSESGNYPASGIVHKVIGDDIYLYITNGGYDEEIEDDEDVEKSQDMEIISFDELTLSSQEEIIKKLIERN